MNYILKLKAENNALKNHIAKVREELQSFKMFLNSDKFTGMENGERKDWIATGDVIHALREIDQLLPEISIFD